MFFYSELRIPHSQQPQVELSKKGSGVPAPSRSFIIPICYYLTAVKW
jgi:hypothetical protein